ncbi:hypothetical protein [Planctomyces sp. SH-PL62]|nr:hypothetical protein [Planctomyces sp. SH-PL62]
MPIQPEIALNDDKAGKPVAIHQMIGRKPLVRLREQGVEPIDD